MHIIIGKSIGGELIVGKLEERAKINPEDPYSAISNAVIVDAYSIVVHPDPKTNQLRSIIIPMLAPFDDKAIKEISMDKIIAVIDAPEDVQQVYIKLTTGLDIVSAGTKIIQ